ncbi:hypothetical protein D9X91_14400 [Falsibacillus albus]|uniref:Uncharacterized protein n=1 Tax=Falsibacillus albus TaxID=2478915 RepID=A0A3L7K0T2_9BACI|nr:hypothetical protein D9X91_14400 [Falsibacillus albus]
MPIPKDNYFLEGEMAPGGEFDFGIDVMRLMVLFCQSVVTYILLSVFLGKALKNMKKRCYFIFCRKHEGLSSCFFEQFKQEIAPKSEYQMIELK